PINASPSSLPKSPVCLSPENEVPHISTQKSHQQPRKFCSAVERTFATESARLRTAGKSAVTAAVGGKADQIYSMRAFQPVAPSGYGAPRRYSGLMLAVRITLAHFSVSSAIIRPKSAGEPASVAPPVSVRRAFIVGSAKAALISPLSLSTISPGVLAGTPMPVTALAS